MAKSKVIPSITLKSLENFVYKIDPLHTIHGTSEVDNTLMKTWLEAKDKGVFRYEIENLNVKILHDNFKFVCHVSCFYFKF